MTARPIIFSGPMVRAILSGRKTVTRRLVKVAGVAEAVSGHYYPSIGVAQFRRSDGVDSLPVRCPYGAPGELLWVREEHYRFGHWEPVRGGKKARTRTGRQRWRFVADSPEVLFDAPQFVRKGRHHKDPSTPAWHKRLARFMPRTLARLMLEVVSVRVEQLQSITEEDAKAEGVEQVGARWRDYMPEREAPRRTYRLARDSFLSLWEVINGTGSWAANPWVWRVEFRRHND